MELLPVYKLYDIELVKGRECFVYDVGGNEYLDLYGGHAVISVGHAHPAYIAALKVQMDRLSFYSNSVRLPVQQKLAGKLGKLSRCEDYRLFLCNSGAEAVENALKLASFDTGRKKVIAFTGSFHGRTDGALAVTDDDSIRAPINSAEHVVRLPFNDTEALRNAFSEQGVEIAAVIVETIQGVGGIQVASREFLQAVASLCAEHGARFIADEVQSGFGRSGYFFAFQYAGVRPSLIAMAKGMGNGFPIGGVLSVPEIEVRYGMLGTTFGGNPLACAAADCVLDIIQREDLVSASREMGRRFMDQLSRLPHVTEVRGMGLMIGLELDRSAVELRADLIRKHGIFTGGARQANVIRFLPPLNISWLQLERALAALEIELSAWTD